MNIIWDLASSQIIMMNKLWLLVFMIKNEPRWILVRSINNKTWETSHVVHAGSLTLIRFIQGVYKSDFSVLLFLFLMVPVFYFCNDQRLNILLMKRKVEIVSTDRIKWWGHEHFPIHTVVPVTHINLTTILFGSCYRH